MLSLLVLPAAAPERIPVARPDTRGTLMEFATNASSLAALRQRFRLENPNTIADWLLGEHPQTAAFVVNWIGDVNLMQVFLESLPAPQQADLLCRIGYLDATRPLDSFQADLLVEALHAVMPGPRSVSGEEPADEETHLAGLSLVQAYCEELDEAEFETLILELEELDRNLARLCHNRYTAVHGEEPQARRRNIHAVLNLLCDFISYQFNRSLAARTTVYVDAVELQSDEAYAASLARDAAGFKVVDGSDGVVMLLRFAPRLLYHFLEMSYGAPRPFLHANFEKTVMSPLEVHAAEVFAKDLARALLEALEPHADARELAVGYLRGEALHEQVAELGEDAVVAARLSVKVAKTMIGGVELVFPASQVQLDGAEDSGFLAGLLPPTRGSGPRGGTTALLAADPPPGGDAPGAPIPGVSRNGDELPATDGFQFDENLEELLFESSLEDAELAQDVESEPTFSPLDLLLQGYSAQEVEAVVPHSVAEQERMAGVHYAYGSILFQREHYAEAADAFAEVLEYDAGHANAQLLQAAAWGEQGLYLKEILTYKRLIAEESCLPEVLVLLSRRLSFLGKVDEALHALKSAVNMGFHALEIVDTDPCFVPLRSSPRWQQFTVNHP